MSRIGVDVRLDSAHIGFDAGFALAPDFAGVRRQVSAAGDRAATTGTEGFPPSLLNRVQESA